MCGWSTWGPAGHAQLQNKLRDTANYSEELQSLHFLFDALRHHGLLQVATKLLGDAVEHEWKKEVSATVSR